MTRRPRQHRSPMRRRPPTAAVAAVTRVAVTTVLVAGLAAAALTGCKSKTPPADSGPGTTAAPEAVAPGAADTTVPVGTTLFEAPFYTVVAGDTIGKIATKLGVPAQKLIDANGIDKPDKIQVGQKLRVPAGAAAAGATTTTAG